MVRQEQATMGGLVAWIFELGRYKMACSISGDLRGPTTVTVSEDGREIYREEFTKRADEDTGEFNNRVWQHAWTLQDQYRNQAMAGQQRELERQVREG